MKKVFMTKRGVLIYPIYITNRKIRKDTKKLTSLQFSEFIRESLEDNELSDKELFLAWACFYATIAKN
jgi:hypothetical protein